MNDFSQGAIDLNRNGLLFLNVDLDTALTFADIALQANDNPEKRSRNRGNARKAYHTVLRLSKNLTFTEEEARQLQKKMEQLRFLLARLGTVSSRCRFRGICETWETEPFGRNDPRQPGPSPYYLLGPPR